MSSVIDHFFLVPVVLVTFLVALIFFFETDFLDPDLDELALGLIFFPQLEQKLSVSWFSVPQLGHTSTFTIFVPPELVIEPVAGDGLDNWVAGLMGVGLPPGSDVVDAVCDGA